MLNIPKTLYWVVYTVPYLNYQLATTLKPSFNDRKLQRSRELFLVAWVGYRTAMQYSVRSPSSSTVPYSMKNLIACFQLILCLRNTVEIC